MTAPLWQDAVPFYAAWLTLMQLQRQADADMMQLLAGIAISDRADTAIDGRFNRENPEALEQMRQADRDAEGAVELLRPWPSCC